MNEREAPTPAVDQMHVSCGHDPRRCCDECCPDEEGSNGSGGGCNVCASAGLSLPRMGAGITGEQVANMVDGILTEVNDPYADEALRFVLHITRGDPCPKSFEDMA